jgi:hypothetical protein
VSTFTGKIPAEQRLGREMDKNLFRVFGSKAFVHIPKEKQKGKFGPRALEGILVGYTNSGYLIELPGGQRVASRDVKFDESLLPQEYNNEDTSDDSTSEEEDEKPEEKSLYFSTQEEKIDTDRDQEEVEDKPDDLDQILDERLEKEAQRQEISKENIVQGKRRRNHVAYEVYKTLTLKDALETDEKEEWIEAVCYGHPNYSRVSPRTLCKLN